MNRLFIAFKEETIRCNTRTVQVINAVDIVIENRRTENYLKMKCIFIYGCDSQRDSIDSEMYIYLDFSWESEPNTRTTTNDDDGDRKGQSHKIKVTLEFI